MKKTIIALLAASVFLASCAKNNDWHFPDFDYSTAYFPYQSPVRTITLGDDIYDNSADNLHRCSITATMGGVYSNKKNVGIDVVVDNTLTNNLYFTPNNTVSNKVLAMPSNYYTLGSLKINIPPGQLSAGLDVQLTDAFFADPKAISNNYVIPLRITGATGVDSVLRGKSGIANPDRRIASNWGIVPKDYILYAVKYINPYHGVYLRRGVDDTKGNGGNTTLDNKVVYHAQYVEKDELCNLVTTSLTQNTLNLVAKNKDNTTTAFQAVLAFDNAGKCVVSAPAGASYTLSGTGEFVKLGDMWGNQKRNVIHLKYQLDLGPTTHNFTDTIVVRDRGVKLETFSYVVQ